MTGYQHLTSSTGFLLIASNATSSIEPVLEKGYALINQNYLSSNERSLPITASMIALYYLGTLLPDIDIQSSTISRILHFHLPITHRTWTHTIWIPILLFIASLKMPILLGLVLGYMSHLICDSISTQGVCFLYPLTQYKTFYNGAKIKNHHYIKLYDNTTVPITGWIIAIIPLIIGIGATLVNYGVKFTI